MGSILFDEYLNSGLAFWFTLFTVIFEVIGLFWTVLHEYGVIPNPTAFLSIFGVITFFTGFVYYIWVGWYLNGYTDTPTQYAKLLSNIRIVALQLSVIRKDYDSERAEPEWEKIQEILYSLTFYSYKLYNPHDHEKIMHKLISLNPKKSNSDKMIDMTKMLLDSITILEKKKQITSASMRAMAKYIDSVIDVTTEHIIGEHVVSPPWFKNHFRISLGLYFSTYIPYQLADSVGWVALIVYPVIMDILVGPVIIRYWLRDPFNVDRPWRGMEIERWRSEHMQYVKEYFK